jgi:hypothetical protein
LTDEAVRDERLKMSVDMLQLALKDVATLPTTQQQHVREAVRRLQAVQQWCKTHAAGVGN